MLRKVRESYAAEPEGMPGRGNTAGPYGRAAP